MSGEESVGRAATPVDLGGAHLTVGTVDGDADGGVPGVPEVTAAIKGDIDLSNADRFRDAVVALAEPPAPLRLDLDGVAFMDSTGVRALLAVSEHVGAHGGSLRVVCGPATPAWRLLDLLGLRELFGVDA
jgi:anti-sigma B factor antagonist